MQLQANSQGSSWQVGDLCTPKYLKAPNCIGVVIRVNDNKCDVVMPYHHVLSDTYGYEELIKIDPIALEAEGKLK